MAVRKVGQSDWLVLRLGQGVAPLVVLGSVILRGGGFMALVFRYRPVGVGAKFLLVAAAAMTAAMDSRAGMAQEVPQVTAPRVVDGGVPTLHVYTNLVQVPTLVLTMSQDLIDKPIAESRFSVSIDSGRWFRATHVRREGDDPISLSILMDMSGEAAALLPKIGDAIGNLAPVSLHVKDRVSVYALGCSLVRSVNDTPPYRAVLKSGVATALERTMPLKSNQPKKNCELRGHLWDGLAAVAVPLSDLPGRRVILVVTDGHDTGSKRSWNEVREYAQMQGIAIFALNFAPASSIGMGNYRAGRGGYLPSGGGSYPVESALLSVCELSGGIVMRPNDTAVLPRTLEQFATMLRERYIVEFPRPANSTAGEHGMEVKIDKGIYKIRPSGVSVPIPDASLMSDPTTVPSDPSRTPEQGPRKPMTKPQ
jgi:hypothetical protein